MTDLRLHSESNMAAAYPFALMVLARILAGRAGSLDRTRRLLVRPHLRSEALDNVQEFSQPPRRARVRPWRAVLAVACVAVRRLPSLTGADRLIRARRVAFWKRPTPALADRWEVLG